MIGRGLLNRSIAKALLKNGWASPLGLGINYWKFYRLRALDSMADIYNKRVSDLKGLGEKSEECLNEIGIYTRMDLEKIGAIGAFLKMRSECCVEPSLNLLYAMVGALEDKNWLKVAKEEKGRLLMELEGYKELEALLRRDG
nr:TfoX/Sxy family DNA transformation protein [endosymbiont of Lamellibrachia barhami]